MEEIKSYFAAEESVQDVRRSDIKKLRGGEGTVALGLATTGWVCKWSKAGLSS